LGHDETTPHKNESVKGADVDNGSLTAGDVKNGSLVCASP
jgi:hypothetical protein